MSTLSSIFNQNTPATQNFKVVQPQKITRRGRCSIEICNNGNLRVRGGRLNTDVLRFWSEANVNRCGSMGCVLCGSVLVGFDEETTEAALEGIMIINANSTSIYQKLLFGLLNFGSIIIKNKDCSLM